ncbi:hypothetical protein [Sagittula sp. MA-2]|nr:hypothetical protein [Sagittula sp. MA-2]WHZ34359.1 hypothetical protein QNI11_17195 [Sagittula sp. MA-2]
MRVLFVRHPLALVAGLGIAANTALIRNHGPSYCTRSPAVMG